MSNACGDPMSFSVENIQDMKTIALLKEQLRDYEAALKKIQNANGSPDDEDFVTTEARETLAKWKR